VGLAGADVVAVQPAVEADRLGERLHPRSVPPEPPAPREPPAPGLPKTFFAKDDGAVASVLVRGDAIPAEVKTFLVGQLELAMAEQRKMIGADPAEKAAFDWTSDAMVSGIKTLLDDTKELSFRLFIDEKADEFSIDASLTPRPGTAMARQIASLAGKTSLPAGIVGTKDMVARGSVKVALPEDMKQRLGEAFDAGIADLLKSIDNEQERAMAKRVFDTLTPTLKAAELDAAVGMIGPDAKGRYTLIGAAAVKNGKEIEKLLKEFAPMLQEGAEITFDVEKAGDFTLHKVALKDVPPEMEKIFGSRTVWLAVSDAHVAFSLEPDGTALRAGLKATPAQVPLFTVDVAVARIVPLVDPGAKVDAVAAGQDAINVTITGGEALTLKARMKGKVIQLLMQAGGLGD
jgi:hypothetical protein